MASCPIAIAKSLQSCPTLCDPIDGSPPGFPIPGILQARILAWVAISLMIVRIHYHNNFPQPQNSRYFNRKISFTLTPKNSEILIARASVGSYLLFSIAMTVCLVTSRISARSSCLRPFCFLSSLILFFILIHRIR